MQTTVKYEVEGLPFDTLDMATVVAERLFKRYKRTRSITILDSNGEEVRTLNATKASKPECPDTIDMFGTV